MGSITHERSRPRRSGGRSASRLAPPYAALVVTLVASMALGPGPATASPTPSPATAPATARPIQAPLRGAEVNQSPTVSVTADKTRVRVNEEVQFTATVTDPDPNDMHTIEWYVDGVVVQEQGTTLLFEFQTPGTHTVRVVVTDTGQQTAEDSVSVSVWDSPPTGTFSVGSAPKTRTLTVVDARGSAVTKPGRTIATYQWDLNGNGTYETTCEGPFAGVRWGSTAPQRISLVVVDSAGEASSPITVTVGSITSSKVERKYADRDLDLTAAGCAGPAGDGVVPEGSSPEDMKCYTTVRTGIAEAMAPCFRRSTEFVGELPRLFAKEIYTSAQQVKLNGIDVKPLTGAFRIDSLTHAVSVPRGSASMNAGKPVGRLTFFVGKIAWKLPGGKAGRFPLGKVSLTEGAQLFGLDVEGDAKLDLVYRGAELPVWIHLPSPLDVSATVTFRTDNLKGLRLDDVRLQLKNATFGAFTLNNLDLRYNVSATQFDGFADLSMTSVGRLVVSIQIVGRTVTMFAADFTPIPPLALGSGVFLQHINFNYDAGPPLSLLGGVRLTAGPPIKGTAAAAIDGTLKFVASDPWLLRADGSASIAGFGVAKAFIQYRSNGMFRMGGSLNATIAEVARVNAGVDFWLYAPTGEFNAQARGDVCVWKGCGGGAVVVSSTGIGACVYTWIADFGLGYRWSGEFKGYLTGCDIGHWATAWNGDPGLRVTPVTQEDLTVKPGQRAAFFRFASESDPPRVRVTGPDGTVITVPTGTENYVQTDKYVVLQVPPHKATYVMVAKPAAGRWRVETLEGSPGLVAVDGASALPEPRVRATVSGRGYARTLSYQVKRIPGQTVTFVERAGDMTRRIGVVKDARGTLRFRPGPGRKGTRQIVAIVQQGGQPRANLRVASYAAPPPQQPARTRTVRIGRTATSAVVTWARAARAQRWRIVVTVSDGRRFSMVRGARRLVLRGIYRHRTVRVSVRGISAGNVTGRPTVAISRGRR